MKTWEKSYFEGLLPFPQKVRGQEVSHRTGVRYTLKTNHKEKNIDLAPFPGLCPYSLKEVEEIWETLLKKESLPEGHPVGPVDFALYQFHHDLEDSSLVEVKNNHLLSFEDLKKILSEKNIPSEAQTFKVKLSGKSSEYSTLSELLKEAAPSLKGHCLFRFDFNGRANKADLQALWKTWQNDGLNQLVDYFEEPFLHYEDYKEISESVPIAHEENLEAFLKDPRTNPVALVIKPSQMGISALKDIHLKHSSLRIILSSAFDTQLQVDYIKGLTKDWRSDVHGLGAKLSEKALNWTKKRPL